MRTRRSGRIILIVLAAVAVIGVVIMISVASQQVKQARAKAEAARGTGSKDDPDRFRTGDAKVDAAIVQARTRWPEFVSAFSGNSGPASKFLVMVAYGRGGSDGACWLEVRRVDEKSVRGIPDSDVLAATPAPLYKGQEATVPVTAVVDWAYINASGVQGRFLKDALPGRKKR